MELNAYILFERLKRKYPAEMYGDADRRMQLLAPELYIDNTLRFRSNHVYLATVEHLPQRPVIEKNTVLICIGDNPRLAYYKEHAALILLRRKVDFFEVYKSIQEIYELFYTWESSLLKLFLKSPTIEELLLCSYPVFERPLIVLNSAFQYVASVFPQESRKQNYRWNRTSGNLDSADFLEFLRQDELNMETHGFFMLDLDSGGVLCVNLFDSDDEYIGCLCMDQSGQPFIAGEEILTEQLAGMIVKTAEASPSLLKQEQSSLKKILQNLMDEMPLGPNQKLLLKSSRYRQNYVCASIHCLKHFSALPVSYICSVLEALLKDSIFFEQNHTILGLIPFCHFEGTSLVQKETEAKILSLMEEMQLCAGLSNDFPDLYLLRTYYFQAEAAIDNGQLYAPGQRLYVFSDYALYEMIVNSFGGFPIEAYFPAGFRRLLEHDRDSEVSYLDTLSVFLEENMSYAKAARRLFIHRSTLIERMARILQELSFDTEDPDKRLQLQIVLKALQIESQVHGQRND